MIVLFTHTWQRSNGILKGHVRPQLKCVVYNRSDTYTFGLQTMRLRHFFYHIYAACYLSFWKMSGVLSGLAYNICAGFSNLCHEDNQFLHEKVIRCCQRSQDLEVIRINSTIFHLYVLTLSQTNQNIKRNDNTSLPLFGSNVIAVYKCQGKY